MNARRHIRHHLAPALAAAALLVAPASRAGEDSVLGEAGKVYRVIAGSYGELIGDERYPAAHPALALEVLLANGKERRLVPGTAGPELESSPALSVEPSSGAVYLVWNSTASVIHSQIRLASFQASEWSEVIEVSGNPFSLKLAPRLAVTREEIALSSSSSERVFRTLLHTVWWEETGAGWHIVYAPIELRDGAYVGSNQLHSLSELVPGAEPSPVEPASSLASAPAIQGGSDGHSVVAAITDPGTGELLTLRVRLLPLELSELARDTGSYLANEGSRLCAAGGLPALAQAARDRIFTLGGGFRESVRRYLADEVRDHLVGLGASRCGTSDGVATLAEEARAHIVLIGAQAPTSEDVGELDHKARAHIVLIGVEAPAASEGSIEVISRRPAPETGEGPTRVYLSADARHALVVWQPSSDALLYRESEGQDWGPIHKLVLDEALGVAEAHRILQLRVLSR